MPHLSCARDAVVVDDHDDDMTMITRWRMDWLTTVVEGILK